MRSAAYSSVGIWLIRGHGTMMIGGKRVSALAILCLTATALALGACREEERGRVLTYEPGDYRGASDQPLTEQQVDELRARAASQGGQ